jgi:hypothetical protein
MYGPALRLAYLQDKAITESSGLAASRRDDDLLWTHNDSGNRPLLFAFDRRGRSRGTFAVTGATVVDWEDMAAGPGPDGPALYIGDIGDNERSRDDCAVYRVPEPKVGPPGSPARGKTAPAARFPFRYPDGPHDAETLMAHPRSGDLYLVTKGERPPVLYRLPRPRRPGRPVTLERLGALKGVSRSLTGGAISPDGRRVVLRDYAVGFEYLLPDSRSLAPILRTQPALFFLASESQGEAIAYRRDGRALLTTSEGRPTPLNELVRLDR